MTYPAGVTTVELTLDVPATFLDAPLKSLTSTVKPRAGAARRLVWEPTGESFPFIPRVVSGEVTAGAGVVSIEVPATDQEGWEDGSGQAVTGFAYEVVTEAKTATGRAVRWAQLVQPVEADAAAGLDLDLEPDSFEGSGYLPAQFVPVPGPGGSDEDVAAYVADSESETAAALSNTFVGESVGHRPGPTEAAIRAQAAHLTANGGGTVLLPPGQITLTAPLPILPGVKYVGQEPFISHADDTSPPWIPDSGWTFTEGTVLVGDGTFACFEANTVAAGSADGELGATDIPNAGIRNLGIRNFTYGIHCGATNVMGMTFGELDRIWIRDCTEWGVWMDNFQHVKVGSIFTAACANGQMWGAHLPGANLLPGNSKIDALFNVSPADASIRYHRGIVFEAEGTNETLNELLVGRAQSNCFGRTVLTETATLTSGSTSVAVADGTKYRVGMPVKAGTTIGGYTQNYVYVVASVVGNNITLANQRSTASISASASGSLSLSSSGFANLEIVGLSATSQVAHCNFQQVDVEGGNSVGVYADNFENSELHIVDVPPTPLSSVVGRACTYTNWYATSTPTTDFDATSTTSAWYGGRGTTFQRPLRGQWIDQPNGLNCLSVNGGSAGAVGGDIHGRVNGFLYPAAGMGERVYQRDTSITLSAANMGVIVFNGAAGQTFTLPTIVTDTSPGSSHIGCWYEIVNTSTDSLSVATAGSQLINGVAAKTSLTVAAGAAVKVTATKNASGTLIWYARAVTLA